MDRSSTFHCGELTLEHLRAWEGTYLHGISRVAQDTAHLHLCLMNSLTQAGKDKVRLWSDQFILNGRGIWDPPSEDHY